MKYENNENTWLILVDICLMYIPNLYDSFKVQNLLNIRETDEPSGPTKLMEYINLKLLPAYY